MNELNIALATAAQARSLDEDLPPLLAALTALGVNACVVDWDAAGADWSRFDIVVLRSTWDYAARSKQFLAWIYQVSAQTHLLNPATVVQWSTDKHYLADLAARNIATVPSHYIEPFTSVGPALRNFLAGFPDAQDFVVKPCIGAGSRDTRRHGRGDVAAATTQIEGLLAQGRSVLLQPYLDRVDSAGETALVYIDGVYSHAIRKGPLLARGADSTSELFAAEQINARLPDDDERTLGDRVIAAIPHREQLLYARVDLIRDNDGAPLVLELELIEPSLFFDHAEGSAQRFAAAIIRRARHQRADQQGPEFASLVTK